MNLTQKIKWVVFKISSLLQPVTNERSGFWESSMLILKGCQPHSDPLNWQKVWSYWATVYMKVLSQYYSPLLPQITYWRRAKIKMYEIIFTLLALPTILSSLRWRLSTYRHLHKTSCQFLIIPLERAWRRSAIQHLESRSDGYLSPLQTSFPLKCMISFSWPLN